MIVLLVVVVWRWRSVRWPTISAAHAVRITPVEPVCRASASLPWLSSRQETRANAEHRAQLMRARKSLRRLSCVGRIKLCVSLWLGHALPGLLSSLRLPALLRCPPPAKERDEQQANHRHRHRHHRISRIGVGNEVKDSSTLKHESS